VIRSIGLAAICATTRSRAASRSLAAARLAAAVPVAASLAIALAACGSGGGSPAASTARVETMAPSVAAPGSTPASSVGSAAGQTDTDWGRIWDTLPAGFPSVPGATTGEETATGPASANLVVPGKDAKAIATGLQAALTEAGYTTIGLSRPLENGGYVLEMTGPPAGCHLQVAATPTGSLTTVVVLFGAGCPHD
jgi:hypothetical protein